MNHAEILSMTNFLTKNYMWAIKTKQSCISNMTEQDVT